MEIKNDEVLNRIYSDRNYGRVIKTGTRGYFILNLLALGFLHHFVHSIFQMMKSVNILTVFILKTMTESQIQECTKDMEILIMMCMA